MSDCASCAHLEAENEELRAEIERLKELVKRLRKRLKVIKKYAEEVLKRTRAILCHRSGVPRGKWSYARGADVVADHVEKLAQPE